MWQFWQSDFSLSPEIVVAAVYLVTMFYLCVSGNSRILQGASQTPKILEHFNMHQFDYFLNIHEFILVPQHSLFSTLPYC